MIRQYNAIKEQNKDSLLFYRMGDFYEMFFEDAVTASRELGLTLTKRNKEKGVDVPLAGVPYHAVGGYIAKLIAKGYKVAICDQTEDPRAAKGLVKREVTRIITPGTVIDPEYLDAKTNNYLLGIRIEGGICALAWADVTTGEFRTSEFRCKDTAFRVLGEINKLKPREILLEAGTYDDWYEKLAGHATMENITVNRREACKNGEQILKDYFHVVSLESYGLSGKTGAVSVCALVLSYLTELQKGNELPIGRILYTNTESIMELNLNTQRNLEILERFREKGNHGTLVWVLDQCMTAMGSRLLKVMIKNPLLNPGEIEKRQDDAEMFVNNVLLREEIRARLKNIYDVERIMGKLVLGNENGKDLVALKISIGNALEIFELLENAERFAADREGLLRIRDKIARAVVDDPPFSIREGKMIREGYSAELDELREISGNGKDYLAELETRERERTGIKSLRIKFNKVFGYFIEITKTNEKLVPPEYIRRQTLVNAERYTVAELKELEEKILNADEKIEALEYQLFKELSGEIRTYRELLQDLAWRIAYLDVICDFAHVAVKNNYVRPEIHEGADLSITGGRHPVVEKLIPPGEYVKNNAEFNGEKKLIILTGPNMSGKSTYMKQIALILILTHIGSFVPADYARIPLTDKIFTRIGASDDLLSGQSTFMLEMSEVANIVHNATERSFIILDEIGRGTSTFDGISIATAITEYIHERVFAKTIFATHYHELTQLEEKLKRAANYRIEVREAGKEIVFLREIVRGGADKSYGIEVARLAGLPREILERSKEILHKLEDRKELIESRINSRQLVLFGTDGDVVFDEEEAEGKEREAREQEMAVVKEKERREREVLSALRGIDTDGLTPIDALLSVNRWKKMLP
ncbi:MAG: DNA mismatch repair protein MutS [Fusobacteriaceae bacterium]|jgi:DNA mismatch repair protein MutS|nr:DNA mismatch repair protein MutS [Fusobacteriaceae bacterium]